MMNYYRLLLLLTFLTVITAAFAQCPPNIDLAEGTFDHWTCSAGNIAPDGKVNLVVTGPVAGRHTLIKATPSPVYDRWVPVTVACPNGNANTLRLGNDQTHAEAEQASYTYTIPADKQNYNFTYYWAAVLQDPGDHQAFEKPKFSVKLTDVTTNSVIDCGTRDFFGDELTGFIPANAENIYYRDWSTVTLNITGRAGHTLRFDFTTNDCAKTVHFGYAYLSFDNPCLNNNEPITGNNYCDGLNKVTLFALPGYDVYKWHYPNSTTILGTGQSLEISPSPPEGTQYVVDAIPQTGLGCPATFSTTVHKLNDPYLFVLKSTVDGCEEDGIDLTDPKLVAGTIGDMRYDYCSDAAGLVGLTNPKQIVKSGVYYIRATSFHGCTDVKPITVTIYQKPKITITQPPAVCKPGKIDISDAKITGGKDPSLTYNYFKDVALNQPMTVAETKNVTATGFYYVAIANKIGCTSVERITAAIIDPPKVLPASPADCPPVNITLQKYKTFDTPGLTYTYWKDAAATIPLADPEHVTESGTYYTIGTNETGCSNITPAALTVTVYATASLTVVDPKPVRYPETVDLSTTFTRVAGYTYSYWKDANATQPLTGYNALYDINTYYIKAVTSNGCSVIKPVHVTVTEPDEAGLVASNTFTPNGDGINDRFVTTTQGIIRVNWLKVFDRFGGKIFETKELANTWDGTYNGKPAPTGTYYWIFNCYDIYRKKEVRQSGYITIIR